MSPFFVVRWSCRYVQYRKIRRVPYLIARTEVTCCVSRRNRLVPTYNIMLYNSVHTGIHQVFYSNNICSTSKYRFCNNLSSAPSIESVFSSRSQFHRLPCLLEHRAVRSRRQGGVWSSRRQGGVWSSRRQGGVWSSRIQGGGVLRSYVCVSARRL